MRSIEVLAPNELTTLVQGETVVLSNARGEFSSDALLGVFYRDERILSTLSVLVDGVAPPLLDAIRTGSSSDRVALLAAFDEYRNGQALVVRRRDVLAGRVDETLEARSFSHGRTVAIDITLETDGASILDLKSGVLPGESLPWKLDTERTGAFVERNGVRLVSIEADEGALLAVAGTELRLSWKADVAVGEVWSATWSIVRTITHRPSATRVFSNILKVESTDRRWSKAIESAVADLSALTIELPEKRLRFIGAGAPWYQAVFGRDSIIAAWESLPLGTALPLDVLDTLAELQGRRYDSRTLEAPGKILHEHRIGRPQVFGMSAGVTYYGSVDSSALFVMLLTEVYKWGAPITRVRALLPAARMALHWCRTEATKTAVSETDSRDRRPFLWYTPDSKGLGNQGWKDSGDCMVHVDASLADGPIATAEAQAYFYEALVGMARLEREIGDAELAGEYEQDASVLANAFVRQFWSPEDGLIALALDGRGEPLRVATTNMGQCLWSGILSTEMAAKTSQRTMQADLLTPWGLRTLGSNEAAYNPLGYHLGTVWAHDTALVAAGFARFGFDTHLRTLVDGLLGAAEAFDWRLPELFAGLDASGDKAPLPYPASCSPQAWSAGAPILLLRSILGLQPDLARGVLRLNPMLGEGQWLKVSGVVIGDHMVSIEVRGSQVIEVTGADDLKLEIG